MSLPRFRRGLLAVCLALALPGAALAGGLYRWVTKDGKVEVGPFPPPGVNAEPWKPEDGSAKPAPAPRAFEPVVTETPSYESRRAPPPEQRSPLELECEERASKRRKLVLEHESVEQKIAALEAKIARLEETLVANEDSRCYTDSYGNSRRECVGGSFDRDASLERARDELETAQSKLADIEQGERGDASDEKCANLPAAPAR